MSEEERRQEIEDLKDWIAARTSDIDQMEIRLEKTYDWVNPQYNLMKMDNLEVWKFRLEIDKHELEEKIKSFEDDYPNRGE